MLLYIIYECILHIIIWINLFKVAKNSKKQQMNTNNQLSQQQQQQQQISFLFMWIHLNNYWIAWNYLICIINCWKMVKNFLLPIYLLDYTKSNLTKYRKQMTCTWHLTTMENSVYYEHDTVELEKQINKSRMRKSFQFQSGAWVFFILYVIIFAFHKT